MVCFVLGIPTASYCFSIYRYNTAFFSFRGNPVYQAGRKFRRISFFKHPPESITVWYSIGKFKKFRKVFLTAFTEFLHIGKIFPSTDYRTQPNDNNIFQFVTDISICCSPWFTDIFNFLFSFFYLHTAYFIFFMQKSKCCCPGR